MTTMRSHMRRGKDFENDVVKWLRAHGYDAEHLHLAGKDDEGDVVIRFKDGTYALIECKAPGAGNKTDLSGWIKEAQTEAANFARARQLPPENVQAWLLIKARGKPISNAYLVQTLAAEWGAE